MQACNICGGSGFEPGPGDRLTPAGEPVRCEGCRSLERHRALRAFLSRLPADFLSPRRALQFAPDGSLDPAWFRTYEGSRHGGENSLDLEHIDRPDASYDFVSLSSVLEFVPDDRRAFAELARIASPTGVIHCTFTPVAAGPTRHFAQRQGDFGRHHVYGEDLAEWLGAASHGLAALAVTTADPATGVEQPLHFFCRRERDAETLAAAGTG